MSEQHARRKHQNARHSADATRGFAGSLSDVRPGEFELTITEGADAHLEFRRLRKVGSRREPVDMTSDGWTGKAQVIIGKKVAVDFAVELGEGTITLTAAASEINSSGSGDWALQIDDPDGGRIVLLEGRAHITQSILL